MNVVRFPSGRFVAVAVSCFLLSTAGAFAQLLFVGTNAPGVGTNLSFTLPIGATNLCLAITNNSGTACRRSI